jgi:hypothetical protein
MVKCKVFMLLVTAKSQYFAQSNHRIPPKNPQDPQKKNKNPQKNPQDPQKPSQLFMVDGHFSIPDTEGQAYGRTRQAATPAMLPQKNHGETDSDWTVF